MSKPDMGGLELAALAVIIAPIIGGYYLFSWIDTQAGGPYTPPPVTREEHIRKLSDDTGISMSEIREGLDKVEGRFPGR